MSVRKALKNKHTRTNALRNNSLGSQTRKPFSINELASSSPFRWLHGETLYELHVISAVATVWINAVAVACDSPGTFQQKSGGRSSDSLPTLLDAGTRYIAESAENTALVIARNHLSSTRGAKMPDLSQASGNVTCFRASTEWACQVRLENEFHRAAFR